MSSKVANRSSTVSFMVGQVRSVKPVVDMESEKESSVHELVLAVPEPAKIGA